MLTSSQFHEKFASVIIGRHLSVLIGGFGSFMHATIARKGFVRWLVPSEYVFMLQASKQGTRREKW